LAPPPSAVALDCRLPRERLTGTIAACNGAPCRATQPIGGGALMLSPGITAAGSGQDGVVWNVLGHRYFLKAHGGSCFCFETFDPPGTFVPLHIHPKQDEFIYMLDGTLDLQLGEVKVQARPGDLVRMPMGIPHAYYNNTDAPTRALFWVSPAGKLKELFDALHDLTDLEEAVRLSALHEVDFVR
jgi:quercetin dioxygenase-like cupin family protein